ncbi:MAG: hypothetical protein L0Y72_24300 [Gemmataceae bacterium]|nr:hypothetical protein [Gemmataceae bacterium]MCI0742168.1 hypothetical protein [Gemmataceae bacterium]
MITFRITTDVHEDRRVVLPLPSDVPTGTAELVVSVASPAPEKMQARTNLADWLEVEAKPNGSDQARYPLRGSVVRYDDPTEPVAKGDWEAAR